MRLFARFRTTTAPLRRRQFALNVAGQSLSWMGNEAYDIALVWLLIDITGSTLLIGTVLTVTYIPTLLVQWFGGILADRGSRRAIILTSDLLRLIITAVFAALVILGRIGVTEVFVFAAFYGLVFGFFNPALGALAPTLVAREEYGAANAISQVGQQIAVLAGPALGGFLVARWNVGAALVFDAITFAIAALATVLMGPVSAPRTDHPEPVPAPAPPSAAAATTSPLTRPGMGEAIRFLWRERGLLTIMAVFAVTNGVNNVIVVLTPVLVRENLHLPASVYGLAGTCAGAAMLIGGLIVGGNVKKLPHPIGFVLGAMVLFGGGIVLIGFATGPLSLYGAYVVTFSGFITGNLVMMTYIQLAVPDRLRGRVLSLLATIAMSMNPLGFLFAGALGQAYGVRAGLWIGGGIIVVLALLVYLLPSVRHLDARARELLTLPSGETAEPVETV